MDHPRRSPLRFLAPLAIVAFAFALLVVVVTASTGSDSPNRDAQRAEERDLGPGVEQGEATTTEETAGDEQATSEEDASEEEGLPDDVYVIKSGDTLGSIAEQVGISVERLQELNPDIDPQALVSGQQIKLR